MIHEHLEGPRTTTRYLRYRPITPPTPLNAPLYARSLYPVPSSSTPSDTSYINSGEVYEFTYTLPTPPNPELDAARLDAEFGDLSIRSDMLDGPIRDKVSPKEPSDWVSQLEAQLDAEERRRRAERDEAVNGEQDKGSEELYKDASAIPGDEDLDLGGIEDGEVRGNARIVEAAEMGDSTAAPKAETETPALPALEVISTLSIPHTALLHVPNRTNDILFTSSLPRPADVPSPITHFFQLIHEAAHRDLAPRRAESGFSEDDDLWHEEPKAQVTYDPPPRFQIRIDGVVRHFGLEVDEERTVVGSEHAGVEVRGVERREMGVPWAKAVMCTEVSYTSDQGLNFELRGCACTNADSADSVQRHPTTRGALEPAKSDQHGRGAERRQGVSWRDTRLLVNTTQITHPCIDNQRRCISKHACIIQVNHLAAGRRLQRRPRQSNRQNHPVGRTALCMSLLSWLLCLLG